LVTFADNHKVKELVEQASEWESLSNEVQELTKNHATLIAHRTGLSSRLGTARKDIIAIRKQLQVALVRGNNSQIINSTCSHGKTVMLPSLLL